MKAKYKFQVGQDCVLTSLLLALMGFHLWSESVHEWLGVVFLSVLVVHIALNAHWFNQLAKGEYSAFRIVQVLTNALLFLLMVTAIITGIMLSKHLLPGLPFHSTSDLVRKTHMTAVHWGQVIIALHLGLHWKMLANFFCRVWHIASDSLLAKYLMPLFFISLAIYGGYAFITREMLPYLLIQVDYAFFDFAESKAAFYLDCFAVIILFAYLTKGLLGFIQPKPVMKKDG